MNDWCFVRALKGQFGCLSSVVRVYYNKLHGVEGRKKCVNSCTQAVSCVFRFCLMNFREQVKFLRFVVLLFWERLLIFFNCFYGAPYFEKKLWRFPSRMISPKSL